MRWLATPSLLLGLVCRAEGADLYVSHLGNDENPGTSPRDPWRAIARANAAAVPGDTVHIRGGPYTETIAPQKSGTETRRVTFRAFGGETVTLTAVTRGIEMQDRAYVTVDVDYEANILRVDREVDWEAGQGVSLPYEGARPDIGAFEFGMNGAGNPASSTTVE